MNWQKKGLIYSPPFDNSWKDNSALTPTPIAIDEDTIRIFCGFRNSKGVSRIGYVDVNSNNPSEIKKVSNESILDIGNLGNFDDNGVILGDVIRLGNDILMYYVGFQLVENVKFLAYSGLAISKDNGNSFERYQKTPILDRSDEALFIRAIHSITYENGLFKIWYATGSGWELIDGKYYPQYDINYIESNSAFEFPKKGTKCIINNPENKEYRIGRPRVYKSETGSYIMNYTYGTTDGRYQAGQAVSKDGIQWERRDEDFELKPSETGWDSMHLCYPALISVKNKTYLFYNGNNMGYEGFGYAELLK
ncbi:MAG: hypothetical protein JXR05_11890 [Flavobacteriaceae bacterium]